MIVNFVNRIYEAQYEIKDNYAPSYDYFPDMTIRSDSFKIIGVIIEKSKGRFLRYDILCTRDLDQTPLSVGDNIHDKALEKTFRVRELIRNTDNTYTCVVEYVIEDTTESLARKYELESEIIAQESKVRSLKDKIEKLEAELKCEKSKSVWQIFKDRLGRFFDREIQKSLDW